MNDYLLLAISMAACLGSTIINKLLVDRYMNGQAAIYLRNALGAVVTAVGLIVVSDIQSVSAYSLIMGLIFGAITALQCIFSMKAFQYGPMGYSSVIISLSMVIPTLSGCIFWNETLHLVQILGILFMIGCIVLSVDNSGRKKGNLKWLLYVGAAFVLTGAIGIMQKLHQSSPYKAELDVFLITAFLFAAVVSFAMVGTERLRGGQAALTPCKNILKWLPMVMILLGGIFGAANNKMNLYLSGVMDSAVFYPLVNGGNVILVSLSGYFVFKERLSRKQWIGMVLGILAVILLCDPFGA